MIPNLLSISNDHRTSVWWMVFNDSFSGKCEFLHYFRVIFAWPGTALALLNLVSIFLGHKQVDKWIIGYHVKLATNSISTKNDSQYVIIKVYRLHILMFRIAKLPNIHGALPTCHEHIKIFSILYEHIYEYLQIFTNNDLFKILNHIF